MQALARHDRDGFVAAERALREAAGMPPFGRLAALVVSGTGESQVSDAAALLAAHQPRLDGIRVYGPAPAPLAMLRGRHRIRFLVHADRRAPVQSAIRTWLSAVRLPAAIRVTIDVDPQSFL
jgi:primosomal protein N' (replication factor Y)